MKADQIEMKTEPTKVCKAFCKRNLRLSCFGKYKGVEHASIYCRECLVEKTRRYRAAIKEVVVGRKACVIWKGEVSEPAIKVLKAIRKGKRTQPEIRKHVHMWSDELGEVLVELILEKKLVRSRVVNGERLYFERIAA